ncbi:ABC transporter ATP-binding protein [Streptomyces hygroscopicus]|uniref:ATP-binding cassette domain-containing protein n=1 Tax=Streptomyces hygroscopicus TaxID=1912 RepID=UPI003A0FFAA7|nr:ABC transporter ATP-binding protein [Streptomyces hygroscopicus]
MANVRENAGTVPVTGAALLRETVRHSAVVCVVLCLVSTATAAASLLLPAALGRALDLLLADAGDGRAARWVLLCTALVLLSALLDTVETVLDGTTNARTTAWLRERLTGHVLAVGPRAGLRFGPGDLVARLVGNAAQAGSAPAAVAALTAAVALPAGALVALGLIEPRLAAVLLGGAPLLILLLRAFARDSTGCAARYQEVQGRIAEALAEAVGGARTIAAAGTADRDTARVLRPLPELSRQGHDMWRIQGRAAAQAVAIAPLLQLGVVAAGGILLTRNELTVGEVVAASRYAALATGVGVLVAPLSGLARARASAARLGEVLAEPALRYGDRRLPPGAGRLELRGVTARRGGRTVLDGVDLVVPGGTSVAVVGRSGAGKSLLAAVAGRLTDPDDGTVLLDGVPLTEVTGTDLRRAVGHAFERPALLGETVADTIALGSAGLTRDRTRQAARAARADAFIARLPQGYDTRCADAPLSGGEAQRLGLARAFAHEGRLLVVDDALSSLDTVTERQVTDALLASTPDRTRLVVAHRAATAARADSVVWLDDGRIRATGSHARLWESAEYRRVFEPDGPPGTSDEGGAL